MDGGICLSPVLGHHCGSPAKTVDILAPVGWVLPHASLRLQPSVFPKLRGSSTPHQPKLLPGLQQLDLFVGSLYVSSSWTASFGQPEQSCYGTVTVPWWVATGCRFCVHQSHFSGCQPVGSFVERPTGWLWLGPQLGPMVESTLCANGQCIQCVTQMQALLQVVAVMLRLGEPCIE